MRSDASPSGDREPLLVDVVSSDGHTSFLASPIDFRRDHNVSVTTLPMDLLRDIVAGRGNFVGE
jgi:hypothetical protein